MTDTQQFLSNLMDYWPDPDLRLEIRCLDRASRLPGPRRWYRLDGIETAARDAAAWAADWTVYHGVLPRAGERGTANDVFYASWLWVDVDGGNQGVRSAAELVKRSGLPAPHIAVVSGSGIHAYWRMADTVTFTGPEKREQYKLVLHRLVQAIGGDKPGAHADSARADCASILRPPGTLNHKSSPARSVRLLHVEEGERLPFAWWRATLPAIPAPATQGVHAPTGVIGTQDVPDWAIRWCQEPAPEGERHHELLKMAARLLKDFRLPAEPVKDLLRVKAAVSPGERVITERELENIIAWAS